MKIRLQMLIVLSCCVLHGHIYFAASCGSAKPDEDQEVKQSSKVLAMQIDIGDLVDAYEILQERFNKIPQGFQGQGVTGQAIKKRLQALQKLDDDSDTFFEEHADICTECTESGLCSNLVQLQKNLKKQSTTYDQLEKSVQQKENAWKQDQKRKEQLRARYHDLHQKDTQKPYLLVKKENK